jgi:hypothetical protein
MASARRDVHEKKRTKTDTSVDTKKIKEQIKQELVAEMRMQNMQMLLLVLKKNRKSCIPTSGRETKYSIPTTTPTTSSSSFFSS